MGVDPALDHLVLGTPDLAATVADLTDRLGVAPVAGGRHVGRGTANHLLGLTATSYLEVIGPDPDQPPPLAPRPFGVDALAAPRLVTWAVHPPEADAVVARARSVGVDVGDLAPMSRRTPAGDLLAWRLTPDRGVVPFVIDWGDTPHPAAALPRVALRSFTLCHPDPGGLLAALAALGVEADVEPAARPELVAVLSTPRGDVRLPWDTSSRMAP